LTGQYPPGLPSSPSEPGFPYRLCARARLEGVGTTDGLGAVSGFHLFHYITDMELNTALAHRQFVRDDLVSFTQPQVVKDRQFARGKLPTGRRHRDSILSVDPLKRQAARGDECSTGSDEANNLDGQLKASGRRWDVTACTALQCFKYRVGAIGRRQYNDWSDFHYIFEPIAIIIIISVVVYHALMCMIDNKVELSSASQTITTRLKRYRFEAVTKLCQPSGGAFARERMLIDDPD
jgi:hypothetical protein